MTVHRTRPTLRYEIKRLYYKRGLGRAEIAKLLGCSKAYVWMLTKHDRTSET